MSRLGRNAELPRRSTDLRAFAKVRRGQEQGVIERFQSAQSGPVAVPRESVVACAKPVVTICTVLIRLRIAFGEQVLPPVAPSHGSFAVQSAFCAGIGCAVNNVATERLQERREGVGIPFTFPSHAQIQRVFELARILGSFQGRFEFFSRPRLFQRGGAQAKGVQRRLARHQRDGGIPQTNRIQLAVVHALGAGQEVGNLAFIDCKRLHIASPCPVGHVRAVNVQNVRQIARQGAGGDRVVIGGLREALQLHRIVGLAGVKVSDDLIDDLAFNFIARAMIPHGQGFGGRGKRAPANQCYGRDGPLKMLHFVTPL